MPDRRNTLVVLAVILAIGFVLLHRDRQSGPGAPGEGVANTGPVSAQASDSAIEAGDAVALPRFVEIGAESCIPCKMMQPILDDMRVDYAGKIEIVMADVSKDHSVAEKYDVRSIPTQVIYDAQGKEVFRHVGFWPREEIDARLRELGLIE